MKIALAQVDIHWEDKESNKPKFVEFINSASEQRVDLILFPEMSLTGFSMKVPSIGETAAEENGTVKWFLKQAEIYNINVGFGYVERVGNSDKGKNTFCVVSPCGEVLSRYSKIHPFSYGQEAEHYTGGEELAFFRLKDFIVSTFICYDLRFPEIFQIASCKASLITIIANWPEKRREHWITLLKARAIENQCYVAGINRVGIGDNIKYSGDSMVIDPQGNVLTSAYNSEALLVCDIDMKEVTKLRESFRLKADRRESLYYSLNSKGRD